VGFDSTETARELERQLHELGNPERAAGQKRYLKSTREHLGVTVPDNRRAVRRLVVRRPEITHDALVAFVQALWRSGPYDCRLAAVLALEARPDLVGPSDVPLLRTLVGDAETWALVDPLAGGVLGRLILADPDVAAELDDWASDPNFWVRRAALLSQLAPLRAGHDFARFAGYADAMLEEREFFIRKAIGWVLRDYGKTHPETVTAWLEPRRGRASGVTMREAVKYLPEDAKGALRAPLTDTDVTESTPR
jgi:3-methyladenine DNA glycosylase AlkD